MANALGIDLGEVYRTVEAVKSSRAQRGASEAAATRTNAISQAAAGANPSNPESMTQLIALDPTMAANITAAYTGMDEAARTKAKAQTEQLAQLAFSVQGAPDPAAAYAELVGQLPPEAAQGLPAEYDPNFITLQLARARELDSIYERIDSDAAAARDQTNALALVGAKASAEGAGGVDTAGSNAVARVVAGFFGGTYGPDGTFGGMDKETAAKSLEVAAKAEELKRATPSLGINQAVEQAAQELGYTVQGVNQAANNVLANGGDPMATGPANDPFNLGL